MVVILTVKKLRSEDEHRIVEFEGWTVEPSHWPNPRWSEPLPGGATLALPLAASDRLRVLSGHPDPGDPSHFTIRYELNGQSDIIDGWLDAGGVVRLTAAP